MDPKYAGHCAVDSPFYVRPPSRSSTGWNVARPALADGWHTARDDTWETWSPLGATLRLQGWKIHLSTTPDNARRTLATVIEACERHAVTFKFLPTLSHLISSNSKSAARSGSGKFATIYPDSDRQFEELVREIDEDLHGLPNPYILSDIRWRSGPVYFRYGAFLRLSYVDVLDNTVSAIVSDAGILVEDRRVPHVVTPTFAGMPPIVRLASDSAQSGDSSPLADFINIKPIHFSNAGGVYRARRRGSDREVVLKEGRPNCGLDFRGRDAVERLHKEHEVLASLKNTGVCPVPHGIFLAWEHSFLEMELLGGEVASTWVALNFPFGRRVRKAERDAYVDAVCAISSSLIDCISQIHAHGWAVGDLHPGNMLIQDDFSVRLVDLEDGRALDSLEAASFNVLSYRPPAGLTPEEGDWFVVSRIIASMFLVQRPIEVIAPKFWNFTLEWIAEHFGRGPLALIRKAESKVPKSHGGFDLSINGDVRPHPAISGLSEHHASAWLIDQAAKGIKHSRLRVDGVLYPGDIAQWEEAGGGLNVVSGMAGVLLALARSGCGVPPEDIVRLEAGVAAAHDALKPGLFDGAAGVSTACSALGLQSMSDRLLLQAIERSLQINRLDLYGGACGIGLAALGAFVDTEDEQYLGAATRIATVLRGRLDANASSRDELDRRPGLMYGWSGVALFLAALGHTVGSETHLISAKAYLERDLAHAITYGAGVVGMEDRHNSRALPYLASGSAGVLFALPRVLGIQGARKREDLVEGFLAACSSNVYAYSGLLNGRAGICAVLGASYCLDPRFEVEAREQLRALRDHALSWEGTLQFPGENYLRLSSDLGTGSAGVLAAAASVRDGVPHWIPIRGSLDLLRASSLEDTNSR